MGVLIAGIFHVLAVPHQGKSYQDRIHPLRYAQIPIFEFPVLFFKMRLGLSLFLTCAITFLIR